MPVMDGYETTKRIRGAEGEKVRSSEHHTPHTTIIALATGSLEEERAVVLDVGCDDYLHKPFREAELFELMSKHLGVRFVYEDGEGSFDSAQDGLQAKGEGLFGSAQDRQKAEMLMPEALAELPAEWLAQLKKGAEETNPAILTKTIEQIRMRDAELADVLTQLVEAFEYDKILAVLQSPKKPVE